MTDFEEFEGGVAVAKAPEEEQVAAAAVEDKPVIEVEAEPADKGIEMEWEVETVPPEEPEVETVTEETVVEEYYDPGYDRDYGRGFEPWLDRMFGQGYNHNRRAVRRLNKHVFTWVMSFFLGLYGVDRFSRGQVGLGLQPKGYDARHGGRCLRRPGLACPRLLGITPCDVVCFYHLVFVIRIIPVA